MRRIITTIIATAALLAPSAAVAAQDAGVPTAKHFSSCRAMNKVYPGGVAKTAGAKNTKTVHKKKVLANSEFKPKVSASLYAANKGLDRDGDKIACER